MDCPIRYNLEVSQQLLRFFDCEHLWDTKPHEAVVFSANSPPACDAAIAITPDSDLTTTQYLCILFSAFPRDPEFGNLIGFSRKFFAQLAAKADVYGLVDITNYIFKSLSLSFHCENPLLKAHTLRLARHLHYWANLHLHDLRKKDPSYHHFPAQLDKALALLAGMKLPDPVVMVMLTEDYLDNLGIWLEFYRRHDSEGKHLVIIAIGEDFSAALNRLLLQAHCHKAQMLSFNPATKLGGCGNGMDLTFLWYVKIHIAAALVQQARRVIYSDLDAYWIQDYFATREQVQAEARADVILSLTHDMPISAVYEWGFTPCAGFFSIEPTEAGQSFAQEWRQMTAIMFDDQIALAELLLVKNTVWSTQENGLTGTRARITVKNKYGAEIAVLGPETAKRVGEADPSSIGNSVIWHPRWSIAPDQHKKLLENGLLTTGPGQKIASSS